MNKIFITISLVLASHSVYAACTNHGVPYALPVPSIPGNSSSSVPANSQIECSNMTLANTLWTGKNHLDITFSGNVLVNDINGFVRSDTNSSRHVDWAAQDVTVTNNGNLTYNQPSTSGFFRGIDQGYGDQNNPDNGNMQIINKGVISVTAGSGYASGVLQWSPTGAALVDNSDNAKIVVNSQGSSYAVFKIQRGTINNGENATISSLGKSGSFSIYLWGDAGWVNSSGYAPNYRSTDYTEQRSFEMNNKGLVSGTSLTGQAVGVYARYPEALVINNSSTGKIYAEGTDGSAAIIYETQTKSDADIRFQKMPYTLNNQGQLEGGKNADAVVVMGKSFDGNISSSAGPDAFNPDTITNNTGYGVIKGNILLADGKDKLMLKDNSQLIGKVHMAGNSDDLEIHHSAWLASNSINGGDDLSVLDNAIDNFSYVNYVGDGINETQVKNFENLYLKGRSDVTFADGYHSAHYLKYSIESGSTAKYTGVSTINADVINQGMINLASNAAVGDNLMIKSRPAVVGTNGTDADDGSSGNLNNTGTIKLDTNFADLKADTVTVEGEVKGAGLISINNIKKSTSATPNAIINLVIAPNDTNKVDEDFNFVTRQRYNGNAKQGLLGNDPYLWELKTSPNGSGHNWVLSYLADATSEPKPEQASEPEQASASKAETQLIPKPVVRPEIPLLASLPNISKALSGAEQQRLHTRLGELRHHLCNDVCFDEDETAGWIRAHGGKSSFDGQSSFALDGSYQGVNLGFDRRVYTDNDRTLYTGVFVGKHDSHWDKTGKGSVVNAINGANGSVSGWHIGGYATAFARGGTYADGVVKYSKNKANISAPSHASTTRGKTLSGSLEVGHSFKLDNNWVIEPQAQLAVAKVDWDNISANGSSIAIGDHTFVTGRLGVRAEKAIKTESGEVKPWAYIGVNHEFSDTAKITYGTTDFSSQEYGTAAELGVGITADLKSSTSLYGDLGYTSDFNDYADINGHLGIRVTW